LEVYERVGDVPFCHHLFLNVVHGFRHAELSESVFECGVRCFDAPPFSVALEICPASIAQTPMLSDGGSARDNMFDKSF
jgi:hypothetical protein